MRKQGVYAKSIVIRRDTLTELYVVTPGTFSDAARRPGGSSPYGTRHPSKRDPNPEVKFHRPSKYPHKHRRFHASGIRGSVQRIRTLQLAQACSPCTCTLESCTAEALATQYDAPGGQGCGEWMCRVRSGTVSFRWQDDDASFRFALQPIANLGPYDEYENC
jgi:hypothetical protein